MKINEKFWTVFFVCLTLNMVGVLLGRTNKERVSDLRGLTQSLYLCACGTDF